MRSTVCRVIRDTELRRSDVGYDFFDHLHRDYYSFSPEVCRMMARSTPTQDLIRIFFVGPLSRALRLAYAHNVEGVGPGELGRIFHEGIADSELGALDSQQLDQAQIVLRALRTPHSPLPAQLAELAEFLDGTARTSPFIRWGLLEPIEIYADALAVRLGGATHDQLGLALGDALDAWATRIPLTDVWLHLSPLGLVREVEFVRRVLARNPATRASIGARLALLFDPDDERVGVLRQCGFEASEVTNA